MASKKTGDDVLKECIKWIGVTRYSHGNNELKYCDCVGFVRLIFKKVCNYPWYKDARGYKGNSNGVHALRAYLRDRPGSYSWLGKVGTNKLRVGDVLFFISPGKIAHVAIYAGKSKIIHSSNSSRKKLTYKGQTCGTVELREVTSAGQIRGYAKYVGAFRVKALGEGSGNVIADDDSSTASVGTTTKPAVSDFSKLPSGAKETVTYLVSKGFNAAGAIGIAANIKSESNFNPAAVGDGGTSFGICQWHNARGTKMKNYVGANWASNLNGQLGFLVYEMQQSYSSTVYNPIKGVPNTLDGAKQAADIFVRKFEIPAYVDTQSQIRQRNAEDYWGKIVVGADGSDLAVNIDFNTTTAKLSSSNNFEYIQQQEEETQEQSESVTSLLNLVKSLLEKNAFESADSTNQLTPSTLNEIEKVVASANVKNLKPTAKFSSKGETSGGTLPIYMTYVEAPFGEVTLGGVTFGTFNVAKNYISYPNYIQSITINKTNGTVNEYTINLVHQISPGDNPNYIAELLSATGYNEITISYGDGAYRTYFHDIKAMITGVKTNFDFSSSVINYTITATSLAYLVASTKLNFPAVNDKPSNVILNLLQDSSLSLSNYFTGMSNMNYVNSAGLIPSNDRVTNIEAVTNKNVIEYLSYLTSLMVNENDSIANKSTYYLVINDETGNEGTTFSIKEIVSDNVKPADFMYEVDVGYPDANMVFDFNVNTNYAWAAAYNSSSKITTYNYDIDNYGNTQVARGSSMISSILSNNYFDIDVNTWKQLTRFPIDATLTTKELLSPLLLLSYIKINNYYFGSKRITSGVYVVTEQTDTISGAGCRTTLKLTRVSSEVETLYTDGRVLT